MLILLKHQPSKRRVGIIRPPNSLTEFITKIATWIRQPIEDRCCEIVTLLSPSMAKIFSEKIQYFIETPGSTIGRLCANIRLFSVIGSIGPVRGFFTRVVLTSQEKLVYIDELRKVFYLELSSTAQRNSIDCFNVRLLDVFEHS